MSTVTPLSYLSCHTAYLRQQRIAQIRPGRKSADHSKLIGQRNERIVCIDILPPDSNRQSNAVCRCDCGGVSAPRVSDFAAGKAKSCECLKIERFNERQRQRAENLNPQVVREIFLDSARTGRWPGADIKVAARHGVPSHAVRAICQLHKERLLAKYSDTLREFPGLPRTSLSRSLDEIEYHWLVNASRDNTPSEIEVDWDDLPIGMQEKLLSFATSS